MSQPVSGLGRGNLATAASATVGDGRSNPEVTVLSSSARDRIRSVNRLAVERARIGYMPNSWILQSAEKSGSPSILAECLLTQATALACSGYPKEARQILKRVEALVLGGATLEPYWSWRLQNAAGIVADDFAELRATWTHHQESLRVALEAGLPDLVATSRLNLGYLAIRIGMYGEALVQLMENVGTDELRSDLFVSTHLVVSRLFLEQGDAELAWQHRQLAEERGSRLPGFEHTRLLLDMTALTTDLYDEGWLVAHVHRIRTSVARPGSELTRLEAALYEAKIHYGAGEVERAVNEARAVVDRCPDDLGIKPIAALTLAGFLVDSGQHEEATILLEGAVLSPAPAVLSYRAAELRSIAYQELGRWREAALCLDELDELSHARTQDVLTIVEFQKASHNADQIAQQNDLLRLKNLELESLNRDKEAIMNLVANDFQSPLTALQLALHLLRTNPSSESFEQHIDTALRTIARVESSAEQLSLAGEIEHGSLCAVTSPFSLEEFLMRLRGSVTNIELGCSIDALIATAPDIEVVSDEDRIRQILESIFSGIASLVGAGAGSRLLMSASLDGARLLVRIEAPALMLADDMVDRIFRTAGALSSASLTADSNTDLSFYVADRLSRLISCPLSVQVLTPRGTEFLLSLPVLRSKDRGADVGASL